jgi:hypothetical protein
LTATRTSLTRSAALVAFCSRFPALIVADPEQFTHHDILPFLGTII